MDRSYEQSQDNKKIYSQQTFIFLKKNIDWIYLINIEMDFVIV